MTDAKGNDNWNPKFFIIYHYNYFSYVGSTGERQMTHNNRNLVSYLTSVSKTTSQDDNFMDFKSLPWVHPRSFQSRGSRWKGIERLNSFQPPAAQSLNEKYTRWLPVSVSCRCASLTTSSPVNIVKWGCGDGHSVPFPLTSSATRLCSKGSSFLVTTCMRWEWNELWTDWKPTDPRWERLAQFINGWAWIEWGGHKPWEVLWFLEVKTEGQQS